MTDKDFRGATPDSVHGRLLEAVHLTEYSAQRACDELKWLLRQDRWKRVSPGYTDINAFLATMDLSDFRLVRESRQDIVRQLAALNAGQRATARVLGVGKETVARDLGARGLNGPAKQKKITHFSPPALIAPETAGPNGPTPYYAADGITIYHGDSREIVPALGVRGLMVTDPPYNVGYHYNAYDDALDAAEYMALLGDVLQMPLVLIHYPEALFPVATHFARIPDKVAAWVYHANTPKQWRAIAWFGCAPDFTRAGQPYQNPTDKRVAALIAAGREARLYDWWHVEQVKNVSREKTAHPCQIPLEIMRRILKVTPYDGPIIDPFCGAGSTLVAAQELGLPAIGIESSEEYCELAVTRLREQPRRLALG